MRKLVHDAVVALGFEEKDARFFADTFREMDLCTLKFCTDADETEFETRREHSRE